MKKRYKRDYIILESKDTTFRFKEKMIPKAFAKLEIKEDKGTFMLYVENLKYTKDGYRVIIIDDNLGTTDVGRVLVNETGKGEFVVNFDTDNLQVKAIALTYENDVPLIGFRGTAIQDYEKVLFKEELEESLQEEGIEEIEEQSEYEEQNEDEYENEYEYEEEQETLEENEENLDLETKIIENKNISKKENLEMDEDYIIRKEVEVKRGIEENEEVEAVQEKKSIKEKEDLEGNIYLIPRRIKKLLKKHKEVNPFLENIDGIKWWKIDISPMSMCGYMIPYLGYINYINYTVYSDVTTLSYKYRHYIFGIKYNDLGERQFYVYGIPGRKHEQPDDGDTGFNSFVPCDKKDSTYGYWLCFIECRSRLIAFNKE